MVLTIWVYYFFRDPERVSINDDNYLVSPADGSVVQVQETNGPKELNLESKKFTKVSIFMNVFDCHVNRSPCSGTISEINYKPGRFINASLDKASEENERNYYKIQNLETLNDIYYSISKKIKSGLQFFLFRKGPLTVGASYVCGFIKSDPILETPNLQFHISPASTDLLGKSSFCKKSEAIQNCRSIA